MKKKIFFALVLTLALAGPLWAFPPWIPLPAGTYQPSDTDLTSLADGITGIVKGADNGGGYSP